MDGICLDDATQNSALSVQNITCYKGKGDFIEDSLSLIRVIIYSIRLYASLKTIFKNSS